MVHPIVTEELYDDDTTEHYVQDPPLTNEEFSPSAWRCDALPFALQIWAKHEYGNDADNIFFASVGLAENSIHNHTVLLGAVCSRHFMTSWSRKCNDHIVKGNPKYQECIKDTILDAQRWVRGEKAGVNFTSFNIFEDGACPGFWKEHPYMREVHMIWVDLTYGEMAMCPENSFIFERKLHKDLNKLYHGRTDIWPRGLAKPQLPLLCKIEMNSDAKERCEKGKYIFNLVGLHNDVYLHVLTMVSYLRSFLLGLLPKLDDPFGSFVGRLDVINKQGRPYSDIWLSVKYPADENITLQDGTTRIGTLGDMLWYHLAVDVAAIYPAGEPNPFEKKRLEHAKSIQRTQRHFNLVDLKQSREIEQQGKYSKDLTEKEAKELICEECSIGNNKVKFFDHCPLWYILHTEAYETDYEGGFKPKKESFLTSSYDTRDYADMYTCLLQWDKMIKFSSLGEEHRNGYISELRQWFKGGYYFLPKCYDIWLNHVTGEQTFYDGQYIPILGIPKSVFKYCPDTFEGNANIFEFHEPKNQIDWLPDFIYGHTSFKYIGRRGIDYYATGQLSLKDAMAYDAFDALDNSELKHIRLVGSLLVSEQSSTFAKFWVGAIFNKYRGDDSVIFQNNIVKNLPKSIYCASQDTSCHHERNTQRDDLDLIEDHQPNVALYTLASGPSSNNLDMFGREYEFNKRESHNARLIQLMYILDIDFAVSLPLDMPLERNCILHLYSCQTKPQEFVRILKQWFNIDSYGYKEQLDGVHEKCKYIFLDNPGLGFVETPVGLTIHEIANNVDSSILDIPAIKLPNHELDYRKVCLKWIDVLQYRNKAVAGLCNNIAQGSTTAASAVRRNLLFILRGSLPLLKKNANLVYMSSAKILKRTYDEPVNADNTIGDVLFYLALRNAQDLVHADNGHVIPAKFFEIFERKGDRNNVCAVAQRTLDAMH